jgi:hypothetical protein
MYNEGDDHCMAGQNQKIIVLLDWFRLIVAVIGLGILLMKTLIKMDIDLNYAISNVVGIYVFLMGCKTYLISDNRMLAWFYLFFSAMMLITVNMIHFRFG